MYKNRPFQTPKCLSSQDYGKLFHFNPCPFFFFLLLNCMEFRQAGLESMHSPMRRDFFFFVRKLYFNCDVLAGGNSFRITYWVRYFHSRLTDDHIKLIYELKQPLIDYMCFKRRRKKTFIHRAIFS